MGVVKMAWRNLWRHSRRTLVTIGAMTLALFVLILYTGLVEGYLQNMERNVLDLEVGDVQAHAGDYLNRPSIYTLIDEPEALLEALDSQGFRATARLLGGGLVAAGESSAGVSFRGIFVDQDARVTQIHRHVSEGQWLDPAVRRQLLDRAIGHFKRGPELPLGCESRLDLRGRPARHPALL